MELQISDRETAAAFLIPKPESFQSNILGYLHCLAIKLHFDQKIFLPQMGSRPQICFSSCDAVSHYFNFLSKLCLHFDRNISRPGRAQCWKLRRSITRGLKPARRPVSARPRMYQGRYLDTHMPGQYRKKKRLHKDNNLMQSSTVPEHFESATSVGIGALRGASQQCKECLCDV